MRIKRRRIRDIRIKAKKHIGLIRVQIDILMAKVKDLGLKGGWYCVDLKQVGDPLALGFPTLGLACCILVYSFLRRRKRKIVAWFITSRSRQEVGSRFYWHEFCL